MNGESLLKVPVHVDKKSKAMNDVGDNCPADHNDVNFVDPTRTSSNDEMRDINTLLKRPTPVSPMLRSSPCQR